MYVNEQNSFLNMELSFTKCKLIFRNLLLLVNYIRNIYNCISLKYISLLKLIEVSIWYSKDHLLSSKSNKSLK